MVTGHPRDWSRRELRRWYAETDRAFDLRAEHVWGYHVAVAGTRAHPPLIEHLATLRLRPVSTHLGSRNRVELLFEAIERHTPWSLHARIAHVRAAIACTAGACLEGISIAPRWMGLGRDIRRTSRIRPRQVEPDKELQAWIDAAATGG